MTLIDALITVLLSFGIGVLAIVCAYGLVVLAVIAKCAYVDYLKKGSMKK